MKRKTLLTIFVVFYFTGSRLEARNIAFFFALDQDIQTFKAATQFVGQPLEISGRSIYRLKVGTNNVYAVRMGSGPVESAISAAVLLGHFQCDLAISVGPIGALDDQLQVGCWYGVATVRSYQKGSWNADGFQMASPSKSSSEAGSSLMLPRVPDLDVKALVDVASGEIFVASSSFRAQLKSQVAAQAVDMNLYGVATACKEARITLWSWRIVSDHADDAASAAFRTFVNAYKGEGGRAVARMIQQLPPDPNSPEAYPHLKELLAPSKR